MLLYFIIFSSPSCASLIENVFIEAHFDRTFFVLLIIIIGFFFLQLFLSFKCTRYVEVDVVLQLVVVVVIYTLYKAHTDLHSTSKSRSSF